MGHELKLVLTGDSHHYCRWIEDERNYIVCGGGGAFLHPTHHLRRPSASNLASPARGARPGPARYPREFRIAETADGKEALFPDSKTSAGLAKGNFKFACEEQVVRVPALLHLRLLQLDPRFQRRDRRRGERCAEALRKEGWGMRSAFIGMLVFDLALVRLARPDLRLRLYRIRRFAAFDGRSDGHGARPRRASGRRR